MSPTPLPIFILGMPRTGTTLVEQLVASHSEVVQGGELDTFRFAISKKFPGSLKRGTIADGLKNLSTQIIQEIGEEYLSQTAKILPGASCFTDKQPINFLYVGFIALCLPNAKIIHCQRDPRDTCLSSFFNDFTGFHYYSGDLHELGQFYNQYFTLMRHWQKLCGSRFLNVQYEDLVTDFENGARRIIEWCGLPWEEAVLHYYDSQTAVKTGSIAQVRRAPYQDSIGNWKSYAEQLQPLIDVLDSEHDKLR